MMERREFMTLLGGAAAAWPLLAARAQQPGKMFRIGDLSAATIADSPLREPLREALRAMGWIEGENVRYEERYAKNRLDRLPALAAELGRWRRSPPNELPQRSPSS